MILSIGSMQCESEYTEKPTTYALCCGCWDIPIPSRIKKKKHSVFNKLVVSLKITVHDQFGVLAPQFLTEGTSRNYISLN